MAERISEEKIYDLLNHVKTDFNEYEDQTLSSEETCQIEDRLLQEVRKMKKENPKTGKPTGRRVRAAIAASAACAAVLLTVSSQTAARELLSSTFQKLIAGSADDKDAEQYQELYTKIGQQSKPLTSDTGEDITAAADSGKKVLTAKDAGVTVRASDVYCDGYMLYYTLVLETDDQALTADEVDGIMTDPIKDRSHCSIKIDGEDEGKNLVVFRKQEDGTYASLQNYCFYSQPDPKSYQDGDIIPIEISMQQFVGVDYDAHDESGEYIMTEPVEGEWDLIIPAEVETSGNRTQQINKEDHGVKLVSVTKAKATLNLILEQPDYTAEPYNDPYNDPNIAILDKNGNFLQWAGCNDKIKEDGSHVMSVTLIDTGEESYVLEVTNKNVDNKTIARIPFTVER